MGLWLRLSFLLLFIPVIASQSALGGEGSFQILGHELLLELDLERHILKARDSLRLRLGPERTVSFSLNKSLEVEYVKGGAALLEWRRVQRHDEEEGVFPLEITFSQDTKDKEVVLELSYHGVFYKPLDSPDEPEATIAPDFIYLTPRAHWYADTPGSLSTFKVGCWLPLGYEAVTQGTLVEKRKEGERLFVLWQGDFPSDACFLVAAKYRVTHEKHGQIDLYTFFFPEEQELATTYLEASRRYLDMYQEMFGPYPFSKFAVVENLFPTGYGMPSYTLLGRAALKLPFIVHISLGHEVAHNWWGNSVFTHPSHGNWCEGLTSYVADYHYQELIGPGSTREYRRELLRAYANYVPEERDFPLEGFVEGSIPRTEKATRAIIYGKAAMFFHMLRGMVGEKTFFGSLKQVYKKRQWQHTLWEDFQEVFQALSGRKLDWFFEQWVYRKGAPFLELTKAEAEREGMSYRVNFELSQGAASPSQGPYHLFLPIVLRTEAGESHHEVEMDSARGRFSLEAEARPVSLAVDPGYDIFRRLHPEELPPTIDKTLGDTEMLVVYPTQGDAPLLEAYKDLAQNLRPHATLKADKEVGEEDLGKSLFLLGNQENNLLVKRLIYFFSPSLRLERRGFVLEGKLHEEEDASLVFCTDNPANRHKGICLFFGQSAEAIKTTGRKLIHYGKYSYVLFLDGASIDKGIFTEKMNPLFVSFGQTGGGS